MNYKKYLPIIIAVLLFFGLTAQAKAQIIASFKSKNFVPVSYIGKALPIRNTPVEIGIELVLEDKIQDLTNSQILWYVDEKLIDKGVGLKNIEFKAKATAGNSHLIKVVITHKDKNYSRTFSLPVKGPEFVFKTEKYLYPGENIISGIPYFFNVEKVEQLEFSWNILGETKTGLPPFNLELKVPEKPVFKELLISVTITNSKDPLESIVRQRAIEIKTK